MTGTLTGNTAWKVEKSQAPRNINKTTCRPAKIKLPQRGKRIRGTTSHKLQISASAAVCHNGNDRGGPRRLRTVAATFAWICIPGIAPYGVSIISFDL